MKKLLLVSAIALSLFTSCSNTEQGSQAKLKRFTEKLEREDLQLVIAEVTQQDGTVLQATIVVPDSLEKGDLYLTSFNPKPLKITKIVRRGR